MLSPYRVLDLTDERGLLCGQMLADLGADVIQIEPPGGSSARLLGPFDHDEPGPERSLYWWSYARNKRGLTCDLSSTAGRDLFLRLLDTADFVIDSALPGEMSALGLGYDVLSERRPEVIHTSITPFGQDGPKAHYADSDLILMAAGGPLILQGEPGREPVRLSLPQAYHHAASDAAGAALIALWERRSSGRGQHVDVSAQQSVTAAALSALLTVPVGDQEAVRASGGAQFRDISFRSIWQAKDGYVTMLVLFGSALGPFTKRLVDWIYEEGGCDDSIHEKDWVAYTELLMTGEEPPEEYARVLDAIDRFTRSKTKVELVEAAAERKLVIASIATIPEVAEMEQLESRDFWRELPHPRGEAPLRYPGAFVRFSENEMQPGRRAPLLGEHNDEIYGELGLAPPELDQLRAEGVI